MRALSPLEDEISKAIVSLADVQQWEFAAFLETANGPLIEIRTLMRIDGADPSEDVHRRAKQGGNIVVHHNHLSQESLSDADWNGLTDVFSETFAHCSDGTSYWGRAKDKSAIAKALATPGLENTATNLLFKLIFTDPDSALIAMFFRKEVINRAMCICGIVEYEYIWGSTCALPHGAKINVRPANEWGKHFDLDIDKAAKSLAQTL